MAFFLSPLPVWIPPASAGVRDVPAGRWWDVAEAPSSVVWGAMARLAWRCGPVVEDQGAGVARWFVAPGAAEAWALGAVRILGHGHYVGVPPADWTREPVRWLLPPRGDCLTDAGALRDALVADVVTVVTGREAPTAVPVATCSYCRHRVEHRADHAPDCAWQPGRAR
ncbi:hypothetical protein [Streptomyces sp. NPDC127098]|uniref:hypothetical protein n=1 Tax=Streptomyces sp. NPDC127098 TaxID=3347137 RepID=UPI003652FF7C